MKKTVSSPILLLICLLCFVSSGFSHSPENPLLQYIQHSWSTDEGLPGHSISAITQTPDGYLWLGTQEGLVRFDGVRFKVFDKSNTPEFLHNDVRALVVDYRGNLWIGINGGGVLLFEDNKFTPFTTKQGLSTNIVTSLCEGQPGEIWAGTRDGGLNLLKNGKFTTYTKKDGLPHNSVSTLLYTPKGELIAGTWGGGFCVFSNNIFYTFSPKNGFPADNIHNINQDSKNNTWVSTDKGLFRFDLKTKSLITSFNTKNGLIDNNVNATMEDSKGHLWIATAIGTQRVKDAVFEPGKPIESLPFRQETYCFFESSDESIWIGSSALGLVQLQDAKIMTLTSREGLSNNSVWSVFEDRQGYIWIGTYSGLNRFKDKKVEVFTTKDGLPSNAIIPLLQDHKGDLWAGAIGYGLVRLENGRMDRIDTFTTKDGLVNDRISVLFEDSGNNLWIGTQNGLSKFKDGTFTSYTHDDGLSNNVIKSIVQDRDGILWISTLKGLNRFENGKFTTYTTKDGLSSDKVLSMYYDKQGILWLGTYGGGLTRLKDGKFTAYTTKEGLYNDVVYKILEDDYDKLWMSCNKGVFSIPKTQFGQLDQGKIAILNCTSYGKDEGMMSYECNGGLQPAGFKSSTGKIMFATIKGAAIIDPVKMRKSLKPVPVLIEKIIVNGTEILPQNKIKLAPGSKNLEFHYTSPTYNAPKRVQFKYRLDGYHKDWTEADTRRTAYFTNLPPGKYHFMVTARDSHGTWNTTGSSIEFYLEPYFYQTWWSHTLGVLLAILAALGIYRLRVNRLKFRQQELERQVAERSSRLAEANKELEKLSIVARQTDNAVIIMDADGNIVWCNDSYTRMFEINLEEMISQGANLLEISDYQDIKAIYKECIEEKHTVTYEAVNTSATGKNFWIQTTLTPILDSNHSVTKLVAIDSDITRLKNAEEAAEHANKAKSEFLARMSHEIRTPMNAVIGFTELILDSKLNEEQRDFASTIQSSSDALLALLNDILDFSKIEAGELAFAPIDFDPEMTVYDVCELMAPRLNDKPVELLCRIDDDVPAYIKTDPGRFRQVLLNLVGNAAKFTENGEIELSLSVAEEDAERIKIDVNVRDTGIGIPADKIESIFEPFHQTDGSITRKYGGTGLGLAICNQIARMMGGEIWAESELGKGSVFHFRVWVEKSRKKAAREPHREQLTGKKVLVLDDNLTNLEIVTHILELEEMKVVALSQPGDTIEALRQAAVDGEPFDIAIIDIQIPGTSGYEVAAQVRAPGSPQPDIPMLAFSSSTLDRSGKFADVGFNGFLPKPVRRKKFLEMIEHLIGNLEIKKEEPGKREIVTRFSLAESAKHSVRILLAEDTPVNQKLAQRMLDTAGYRVTVVGNGKEALEACTANESFDLVFMDIQMPEMNGLDATREIRKKGITKLPIIAMTADSMKGDREKCLDAGMNDYIPKPIKREVVYEMVKRWFLDRNKS